MRTLSIGIFLIVLAAVGLAEPPIGGVVKDSKGPLANVSVTLQTRSQGSRYQITDEKGVYRFAGFDRGSYLLTFEHQGYETVTREVSLTFDDDSGECNVTMVRAKEPAKKR